MDVMMLKIELPPELEAGLAARASAHGISVDQFVEQFLREQFSGSPSLSASERAAAWRELSASYPDTPPLSDCAVTRESIYGDRG
jgi:plasmid stability protein